MIRATLNNDSILALGDAKDAMALRNISGAARRGKMPPNAWMLPLTLEACARLRAMGASMDDGLLAAEERMKKAFVYVDKQKSCQGRPNPLAHIPLKAGIELYDHQVKAYNISLALLIYTNPKKEYQ